MPPKNPPPYHMIGGTPFVVIDEKISIVDNKTKPGLIFYFMSKNKSNIRRITGNKKLYLPISCIVKEKKLEMFPVAINLIVWIDKRRGERFCYISPIHTARISHKASQST